MKKYLLVFCGMLLLTGCSEDMKNVNEKKADTKELVWLIPQINTDNPTRPIKKEIINEYLETQEKEYQINIITYPDDAKWEEIRKIADEKSADIINLGYGNGVSNNPNSNLMQAIADGACTEISESFPDSQKMVYEGKLYGYGNIIKEPAYGTTYSKRFLDETGMSEENLPDKFQIDVLSEEFRENHPNYVQMGVWPQEVALGLVLGDIFYVNVETGECGYVYECPQVQQRMKLATELMAKGYRENPTMMSSGEDPDITIGTSGRYYAEYDQLTDNVSWDATVVFKPEYYCYTSNNVQCIEQIIYQKTDQEELALDFLDMLYTDEKLCNQIIYGEENPDLSSVVDRESYIEKAPENINLCNENQVEDAGGWTPERKEKAYAEYQEQYKNSRLEGFQFVLTDELRPVYESIQEILYPEGVVAPQLTSLLNIESSWDRAWSELKEQIENAGGQEILDELQRQVDEYIKN